MRALVTVMSARASDDAIANAATAADTSVHPVMGIPLLGSPCTDGYRPRYRVSGGRWSSGRAKSRGKPGSPHNCPALLVAEQDARIAGIRGPRDVVSVHPGSPPGTRQQGNRMADYRSSHPRPDRAREAATSVGPSPGKRTLVEQAYAPAAAGHDAGVGDGAHAAVDCARSSSGAQIGRAHG